MNKRPPMPAKDQPTSDKNQTPEHEYDNPAIRPLAFLLAVMRDRTLPIGTRIEAATMALPLVSSPPPTSHVHPDLVLKVPPLTLQ
jgi:hypothetical protein